MEIQLIKNLKKISTYLFHSSNEARRIRFPFVERSLMIPFVERSSTNLILFVERSSKNVLPPFGVVRRSEVDECLSFVERLCLFIFLIAVLRSSNPDFRASSVLRFPSKATVALDLVFVFAGNQNGNFSSRSCRDEI